MLRDDASARASAIAAAVARARREADSYAATLGLKVTHMLGVANTERDPTPDLAALTDALAERTGGSTGEVVTTARVTIDDAMAPR